MSPHLSPNRAVASSCAQPEVAAFATAFEALLPKLKVGHDKTALARGFILEQGIESFGMLKGAKLEDGLVATLDLKAAKITWLKNLIDEALEKEEA